MAKMFYAKINVNSEIYNVYKGINSIKNIMNQIYNNINDTAEFADIKTGYSKSNQKYEKKDIYSFSEIEKHEQDGMRYIFGKINRRHPIFTEKFDKKTRKSTPTVIDNNSTSITFYFDLRTELITFCKRNKFGEKQFLLGFEGILNEIFDSQDFSVFLIKDPFSIQENLKFAHKIIRLKTVTVAPNANEEELAELYDTDVETMERANIHRKTSIFESSNRNNGLNVESNLISNTLHLNEAYKNFQRGYGKLEFDAITEDGFEYHYDSDENSPFVTNIIDEMKNSKDYFIKESRIGIRRIITKNVIETYIK